MTKHSVSLKTDPEILKSGAATPKRRQSKRSLLVGTALLALTAAYIGCDDWAAGQFEISTGDTDVQADGTPAPSIADKKSLPEAQQSVTEASKATIAVSFRQSMIPF